MKTPTKNIPKCCGCGDPCDRASIRTDPVTKSVFCDAECYGSYLIRLRERGEKI
jgi:hypothetical protein